MKFVYEYHSSWEDFFKEDILKIITKIEKELAEENITPKPKEVFSFLKNDLTRSKVVILGQDPYPEEGKATGKAFQVKGLNSWQANFRQASLRNILRLLYKNYTQITEYSKIPKFKEIIKEIEENNFKIVSPFNLFESWEKQGVLLLNSSFTCQVGKPQSHQKLWREFSEKLFVFISEVNPNAKWFLWGNSSQSFISFIKTNPANLFLSRHPMMCSEKYEDDFLKSNCFLSLSKDINWLGR